MGTASESNKNEKGSLYLSSTVLNHLESKENIPAFTPKYVENKTMIVTRMRVLKDVICSRRI